MVEFILSFLFGCVIYIITLILDSEEPTKEDELISWTISILSLYFNTTLPKVQILQEQGIYLGHYNFDNEIITIYTRNHNNQREILETLIHEVWHFIQHKKYNVSYEDYIDNLTFYENEADTMVQKVIPIILNNSHKIRTNLK